MPIQCMRWWLPGGFPGGGDRGYTAEGGRGGLGRPKNGFYDLGGGRDG